MEKKKQFKVTLPMIVGVLVVLVVGWFGYQHIKNQPVSILDEVTVSFEGYSSEGRVVYDKEALDQKIYEVALRKAGVNAQMAKELAEQNGNVYGKVQQDPKLLNKLDNATKYSGSISYYFNKTSELSNEDVITLTVTNEMNYLPIKAETKEFTVSGLKEYEQVGIDSLYETVGYEQFAALSYIGPHYNYAGQFFFEDNAIKGLYDKKNGDSILVIVEEKLAENLKADGKLVKRDGAELQVANLKNISEITNLRELYKSTEEEIAKKDGVGIKNIEIMSYYIWIAPARKSATGDKPKDNTEIGVFTVYQADSKFFDKKEYNFYGYRSTLNADGTFNTEGKTVRSGYGNSDLSKIKYAIRGSKEIIFENDKPVFKEETTNSN